MDPFVQAGRAILQASRALNKDEISEQDAINARRLLDPFYAAQPPRFMRELVDVLFDDAVPLPMRVRIGKFLVSLIAVRREARNLPSVDWNSLKPIRSTRGGLSIWENSRDAETIAEEQTYETLRDRHMTVPQIYALLRYSDDDLYDDINALYRKKTPSLTCDVQRAAYNLAHAVHIPKLPCEMVVYRGLQEMNPPYLQNKSVFVDEAPMSTSMRLLPAFEFAFKPQPDGSRSPGSIMCIFLPAGTRATCLSFFSETNAEEREVLLPPGTALKFESQTRVPLPDSFVRDLKVRSLIMRVYRCRECTEIRDADATLPEGCSDVTADMSHNLMRRLSCIGNVDWMGIRTMRDRDPEAYEKAAKEWLSARNGADSVKTYCDTKQWNTEQPIDPSACALAPLMDTVPADRRQYVFGRMSNLAVYYKCRDRFITLDSDDWVGSINDMFVYCSQIERIDDPNRFLVRIVFDPDLGIDSQDPRKGVTALFPSSIGDFWEHNMEQNTPIFARELCQFLHLFDMQLYASRDEKTRNICFLKHRGEPVNLDAFTPVRVPVPRASQQEWTRM